jgi:hypothetical protein
MEIDPKLLEEFGGRGERTSRGAGRRSRSAEATSKKPRSC